MILLLTLALSVCGARPTVMLPLEVVGGAGTSAAAVLEIPPGQAASVRSLRMRIHNLEFEAMASVQVNDGPWTELTNRSVAIAEPGRSYGGIGGGFATLDLTLPVAPGGVSDGPNQVRFRFNGTDGVVSGFRVLSLNFHTAEGRAVVGPSAFREEDPNAWQAALPEAESIAAGRELWRHANLRANGLAGAPGIRAHCADCHSKDGSDLHYFNFSNASIVARSRFHGLSETEGLRIAAYIRSLAVPNPGRPWNPPYQPGPGLGSQPASNQAAGAGLSSVISRDADSLPFLFPAGQRLAEVFRPDGNLNARELPIALQLPDWNHWLPRIHPMDQWAGRFEKSEFARLYSSAEADNPAFFEKWTAARSRFFGTAPKTWSRELAGAYYSAQLWQLVKTWEITRQAEGDAPHFGRNSIPAATAPAEAGIPDGPAGMGGAALTNEYFNSAWYQLQVVVGGRGPRHIDGPYLAARIRELDRLSGRPEPGRLLETVITSLQATAANVGPENYAEGWRPERNLDPRILVAKDWAPLFAELPPATRKSLAEAFLTAWLEKNLQYPPAAYFGTRGAANRYRWPESLRGVAGGNVWDGIAEFRQAGVAEPLLQRVAQWGEVYRSLAQLFHY